MSEGAKVISPIIGVKPILSNKIGVEKYHDCYFALTILAVLFILCWIISFCDFTGIIK